MTSVFFVLMVSPKTSHEDKNLSMFCCISSSELAFRAHSSANRKSRTLLLHFSSGFILVLACSLLRLNKLPSQHGRENHTEECGGQHATVFDAICDLNSF